MPSDLQRQAGLADGGPSRQDVQRRRLEAEQRGIDVREAGAYARQGARIKRQALDGVEAHDGVEDVLVSGTVEVVRVEDLLRFTDGRSGQKHGSEHGFLGTDVVGEHAGTAHDAASPSVPADLGTSEPTSPCWRCQV